ncbi:MAG: PEP/pyruvate-binding domain-containing protein [Lachnospiraceae bacterium]|nr:PEP/pyruvate-binding domain-containing protein [Lachnospiraceae bacterium]
MDRFDKISTGLAGFDQVIDHLRLGDNVVWQVDSVNSYKEMVSYYIKKAKADKRKLIYVRFGNHEPLLEDDPDIHLCRIDATKGFESFATEIHNIVTDMGKKAFYVFDSLTELLQYWFSDLMIGNFFRVTCPYLYELDTIAYFAIIRNVHTFSTIAGIRETTQLLLDLYRVNDKLYIHPLKVWQRYSPTMFFPHLIHGEEAFSITASSEAAELFSSIHRGEDRLDFWDVVFHNAKQALAFSHEQQQERKNTLMKLLIGSESKMLELCNRYFTLKDIVEIASREIGTGFIGGKSVGMLLARKIIETQAPEQFEPYLESHDSYYLGSDVFYTYIVQNGWWKLRTQQKTEEGYFKYAPELKEKLLNGQFPINIQEQFVQMLEYFGQSPIIVRSSSLLEDNYGNAFAGKYESVFCVNQGTPEERYEAFTQAVRTVYASTMNEDALAYRMNRGLAQKDEQMAILIQRVSGDYYEDYFFPHIAGVGNSSNLYVWDKNVDMNAGMLRLVFGLGTRAVDRTEGDYVRIVTLDDPLRMPLIDFEDQKKYSQHDVDVLSLRDNLLTAKPLEEILLKDIKVKKELFAAIDYQTMNRLTDLGYRNMKTPYILTFQNLLKNSSFPSFMKDMLALLSQKYDYPVDIEFTANFRKDGSFKVNLLQCRPLQTKGLGKAVMIPEVKNDQECFIYSKGNFMGGNIHLPIDYVVYIPASEYLKLNEQAKYSVARLVGRINTILKGKRVMLIGPGRWGTTTPSLGVPVHFTELCNMSVICEVASKAEGFEPELSYGSHFFQDLVEADIFYIAIFDGQNNVLFHPEKLIKFENQIHKLLPDATQPGNVVHVIRADGLEIFSDIVTQTLLCKWAADVDLHCRSIML